MAKGRLNNGDRARKTIYLTGFNPKLVTKPLLLELFNQGGPVTEIIFYETHAYILFQHEESVPYCLALFQGIELYGDTLKLSPKSRTKNTYSFVDHLNKVRNRIRDEYMKLTPPDLPAKVYPNDSAQPTPSKSTAKRSEKPIRGNIKRKLISNSRQSKVLSSNKKITRAQTAKKSPRTLAKSGRQERTRNNVGRLR